MRRSICFALLVTLAGCARLAIDSAVTPPYAIGLGNDSDAILFSQWAFASPARTRAQPVAAAMAVAAIDYLAGDLNTNPRWFGTSPFAKTYMLQARVDVRHVLGIVPNAPSQLVVNTMQQVAVALLAGDQATVVAALIVPPYTLPPQETVAILSNMPYVQSANLATQFAATGLGAPGNSEQHFSR